MKNKIKRTITVIALSLVAIVIGVLVLIVNGVISVNPPQLQVLTDAGVIKYKSFAEGWEDSTEKYAFSATREQVATIIQQGSLNKTMDFECEEPTSQNRLAAFIQGRPYWFTVKWSRKLEHYAAPQGPPVRKEMVYDPVSEQCLLKIWDD